MAVSGGIAMADLLLLSEAQMRRIEPYFPFSHGIARVDDRRVISGIVFVIRNGLRWRDVPPGYVVRTRRSITGSLDLPRTLDRRCDGFPCYDAIDGPG
jgi:transposase